MRRRRQGASALDGLTRLERLALEDGVYPHLVFDSEEHHRATWESVRDEMLADYARNRPGQRPEAWFTFYANEKYGPRLEWDELKTSDTGHTYTSAEVETDLAYLSRHDLLSESERRRAEKGGSEL